ncbi:uncharacterized protein LOC117929566 [Vitis riparia]|nr:uncharacterized protein LOC100261671 [Vitis vinifera]XP_034705771.1 uncharacterized protein LOC117929566 [Vitis riparia]|eukprot:XP_002270842.1 PREDICTED: uncharacterized protein LOC100261671 [Vitis vinifera]
MSDWGAVFVSVMLFILLMPGLLIQIPGRGRFIEFTNFQTSGVSILVHSLIYFTLICIFLLAIGVHMCDIFEMADWAPVLVGVVLFVLLSPGLLFQLPGHYRHVDFGGMKTNGKSIAVHTLIFVAIFAVLIMALHLHIYTG